jgi:hypothetical protein
MAGLELPWKDIFFLYKNVEGFSLSDLLAKFYNSWVRMHSKGNIV